MAEGFDNVNAPQFFDFINIKNLDDTGDDFFQTPEASKDSFNKSDLWNEVTMIADELKEMALPKQSNFRRSASVGDIQNIHIHMLRNGKEYTSMSIEKKRPDVKHDNVDPPLIESSSTTNLVQSKEFINRLAQPKRAFKSDQELNKNEYIPMAEALIKFQHGTPKRFRTKPNIIKEPLKSTIPHSPKLQTNVRSRPTYVLSHEAQEELALNEAKKSQFKAHPVNKKVFQPPVNNIKGRKSTIPEPFKLTALPAKKVVEEPKVKYPEFHARPVPKSVYTPLRPVKAIVKVQHKPILNKAEKTHQSAQQTKLAVTKPLPFSFEVRDKFVRSKREMLVQQCVQLEKKFREFRAKPVPKSVLEPTNKIHSNFGSRNSLHKNGMSKSDDKLPTTQFKAKPPTVLYQKPFKPKLDNRPLVEISDFTLNTDSRAKERENFEYQIKEKEEMLALLKQKEEAMRKQKEEEEVLRARKESEFKAQKIRKYKEITIPPSKQVTNPISPKFSKNWSRDTGDKENSC